MSENKLSFWLIQRATIGNRPGRKGVNGLISLDYMGSAEFEFGEVPNSLKRIRALVADYELKEMEFDDGKRLTVFCKRPDSTQVLKFVSDCVYGQERLKERSELKEWAYPKTARYKIRTNFWWDIVNDWMAWEASPEFEKEFLPQLGWMTPARKPLSPPAPNPGNATKTHRNSIHAQSTAIAKDAGGKT